jgi:hypothetical protein
MFCSLCCGRIKFASSFVYLVHGEDSNVLIEQWVAPLADLTTGPATRLKRRTIPRTVARRNLRPSSSPEISQPFGPLSIVYYAMASPGRRATLSTAASQAIGQPAAEETGILGPKRATRARGDGDAYWFALPKVGGRSR